MFITSKQFIKLNSQGLLLLYIDTIQFSLNGVIKFSDKKYLSLQ